MSNDLLLRLLQAGLLEALGDDDRRRERAETAAVTTAAWLQAEGRPHFAASAVIAIDEASNPTGPAFERAEAALLEEWTTLRNVFPEGPIELIRAILFQAFDIAAAADADLEVAGWYVTRSCRTMAVSAGRWAPVVDDVIQGIEDRIRKRLVAAWAPSLPTGKLVMPRVEGPKFESTELTSTDELNAELEPLSANLQQQYQRVSVALGRHVPLILDDLVFAVGALQSSLAAGSSEQMKAFATVLGKDIRALLAKQARIVESSRLRETLLWWRLAARSSLFDQRYSDIENPSTCALAAAIDLHQISPSLSPEAVEHLLADVVANATHGHSEVLFGDLAASWKVVSKRLALTHLTGAMLPALEAADEGLMPTATRGKLNTIDAAVIAFGDLQVTRLTPAPQEEGG